MWRCQTAHCVKRKLQKGISCDDSFYIWFLNNDDLISISLDVMKGIYNNGKSMEELTAIIDGKYIARIKK